MFGKSFVYVSFQDGTDIYWARSRVIEYLSAVRGMLPEGVNPVIGPDATGVGWVYEYALVDKSGKHNLAELRSFQDWHLRYALESVKGWSRWFVWYSCGISVRRWSPSSRCPSP